MCCNYFTIKEPGSCTAGTGFFYDTKQNLAETAARLFFKYPYAQQSGAGVNTQRGADLSFHHDFSFGNARF